MEVGTRNHAVLLVLLVRLRLVVVRLDQAEPAHVQLEPQLPRRLVGLHELVGGQPLLRLPLGVLGGLTGEALALAKLDGVDAPLKLTQRHRAAAHAARRLARRR